MRSPRATPDAWTEWLQHNRDRGCAREGLIERAMAQGFDRDAIEAALDAESAPDATPALPIESQPGGKPLNWLRWFEAPLTRPDHQPRAWRLDTPGCSPPVNEWSQPIDRCRHGPTCRRLPPYEGAQCRSF